jgi:hypothetical protein
VTFPLTDAFLADIAAEFPTFRIEKKRGNPLQHAIDRALRILTVGGQDKYLTHYHTVLWGVLWVPDGWDRMSDTARYILLRHERVHLRQRRRYGDALMTFLYLAPFFPIGLAYGRARIEWEAYEQTLAATLEVHGLEATKALEAEIVQRFVGPEYGWMWPFPGAVRRWFATALAGMVASRSEIR